MRLSVQMWRLRWRQISENNTGSCRLINVSFQAKHLNSSCYKRTFKIESKFIPKQPEKMFYAVSWFIFLQITDTKIEDLAGDWQYCICEYHLFCHSWFHIKQLAYSPVVSCYDVINILQLFTKKCCRGRIWNKPWNAALVRFQMFCIKDFAAGYTSSKPSGLLTWLFFFCNGSSPETALKSD